MIIFGLDELLTSRPIYKKMKKIILINLIYILGYESSVAQKTSSEYNHLNLIIGGKFQSTVMNFFNFDYVTSPIAPYLPYNYEKNVQGFAVKSGLEYIIGDKYILAGEVDLRYAYLNQYFTKPDINRGWIFDLHLNLSRIIGKNILGLGYSILNTNKKFIFDNPPLHGDIVWSLQFPAISVHYARVIKEKFVIELKPMLIPKDFPLDREKDFFILNLSVKYRVNL
jgi:hypothetical protein